MDRTISIGAAMTLAYGSVLINTMPIWLVSLCAKSGSSDTLPGILASVILLAAAAGCGLGRAMVRRGVLGASAALIVVLPALAVLSTTIPLVALLCAGALFGLALGLRLHVSLAALLASDDPARVIGDTLAAAVIVSLVVLLVVTVVPDAILPILLLLSLILAMVIVFGSAQIPSRIAFDRIATPGWRGLGFLAFFTAMGAYWAFLEVYAARQAMGSISAWLLGGLLASAAGSVLAARVPMRGRRTALLVSMLAAAVSGCATYVTAAPWMVGVSITLNGFFLFMFFPLYLGTARGEAGLRMALYLGGFALGGLIGAAIIALGGFAALAVAILVSGFIALPSALSHRSGPKV